MKVEICKFEFCLNYSLFNLVILGNVVFCYVHLQECLRLCNDTLGIILTCITCFDLGKLF